jgi:hypothetical protein
VIARVSLLTLTALVPVKVREVLVLETAREVQVQA